VNLAGSVARTERSGVVRAGPALGLRWTDIDVASGRLVVNRALQRQPGVGYALVEPKTARSRRTVYLAPGTLGALAEQNPSISDASGSQASSGSRAARKTIRRPSGGGCCSNMPDVSQRSAAVAKRHDLLPLRFRLAAELRARIHAEPSEVATAEASVMQEVETILAQPDVWRAVVAVAEVLYEAGEMHPAAATRVINSRIHEGEPPGAGSRRN